MATAPNRVILFPELLEGEETITLLLNRLTKVRYDLAVQLDGLEPDAMGGEIAGLRARRHELMGHLKELPTTEEAINAREAKGRAAWNGLSQTLTGAVTDVDRLQLLVNRLRRALHDEGQTGVTRDPVAKQRFYDDLDANEKDVAGYRTRIDELKEQVALGRVLAGFGDQRYVDEAAQRLAFREVFEREVTLAAEGAAGQDAQRFGQRAQGPLLRAHSLDDRLLAQLAELETQVEQRIGELRAKVEAERVKLVTQAEKLDLVDKAAREAAGGVARRSIIVVRDKLRSIVRRADVGVTENAWEVRERELARVRDLQTRRARQEQLIDDEMREVIEDGSGVDVSAPSSTGAFGSAPPSPPTALPPPPSTDAMKIK